MDGREIDDQGTSNTGLRSKKTEGFKVNVGRVNLNRPVCPEGYWFESSAGT